MGALAGNLHPVLVEETAEECTAGRRRAERFYGVRFPVSDYERGLYEAEGKTPPKDGATS